MVCLLVQTQGTNIRRYSDYLLEKARAFRDTKTDFVKSGSGRLKKLTIDKGLLRETETVQEQMRTLLRCDVGDPNLLDDNLLIHVDAREQRS
jgi:phosphatidylinositol-binding clathrin assembly protein